MERARDMLIGALDRVIQLATNQGASGSSQCGASSRTASTVAATAPSTPAQPQPANSSTSSSIGLRSDENVIRSRRDDGPHGSVGPNIEEHRQLFGFSRRRTALHTPHNFEPPRACVSSRQIRYGRSEYKGKGKRALKRTAKVPWKKSCICLKSIHQDCKPSAVEKMELAKLGLGLAELSFDHDGDADHIHSVLVGRFPQLESCGGYTLLRLNDNSHDLIEIEFPSKGMTVPYLKDILNQAKLFIRPLQKNITEGIDMQEVCNYLNYL